MGRWVNVSISKMQNGHAQRDSIMSNLKIETENSLPQRHSKMSNGRLSEVLCCPHWQKAISTIQVKNKRCCFMSRWDYGWMWQHKNSPAQRDSGMSNLVPHTEIFVEKLIVAY